MASAEVVAISHEDTQLAERASEMLPAPEPDGDKSKEVPRDYYFVRFGTFMLLARDKVPPVDELKERLESAIKKESRISSSDPVVLRKDWVYSTTVYPKRKDTTDEKLFNGSDRRKAIRLSDPVSFTVTVPIKNQPEFKGYADIPTDTYYVAWDGITVVVAWPRSADEKMPPRSGGHVVVDILRALAKSADLDFYAQACSPACENMFAHRVMRLERVESPNISLSRVKAVGFPCVDVHLHCAGDACAVARAILKPIANVAYVFAMFKNYARRIRNLESLARTMVIGLLSIDHSHIERLKLPFYRRIKETWRHKSDKRKARLLISSLWLILSGIEVLRSDWLGYRNDLLDQLEGQKLGDLFQADQGDDDKAVMSQDLSFIRSAVEQTANRQDARALAWTTALVAGAGLLGAVIGGLLTAWLTAKH